MAAPAAAAEPALPASGWGALLAPSGAGVAVKDARSGRYTFVNETLAGWLGRSAADVVGRTDNDLFDAALATGLRAAEQAALAHDGPMAAEHRLTLQGRPRDVTVWRVHETDDHAQPWLLSLWIDLGERRQHEAQLRHALAQIEQLQSVNEELRRELADQALRDAASGLYARAHFEDQLRREVDLSGREHREFSLVFVEIDGAAAAAGGAAPADGPGEKRAGAAAPAEPAVQSALGRLLRGGTRAMDAACRFDERRFAVLLSGVGLATAHSRMEGLRRRCATEIVVSGGHELRFSVSMGVASFPHTAHSQAELLDACAAALREAQRRGGNHVALAAIRFEVPS
jgi:GGDEF domain-containing protein